MRSIASGVKSYYSMAFFMLEKVIVARKPTPGARLSITSQILIYRQHVHRRVVLSCDFQR